MKREDSPHKLAPLQLELRAALGSSGCPLCRLATQAEHTFVDSLNYERVLDLKTRDALKASRGLCRHHARVWQRVRGAAVGVAIVYHISVLDLLRDTEPSKTQPHPAFWRSDRGQSALDHLAASAPCPACTVGEDTAARFGEELLSDIADAEVQALFVAAGGLCLPHLRQVIALGGAKRNQNLLIAAQRQAWTHLKDDIEEFIRKNDYRFADEPMTPEQATSWSRALDALVGAEDPL